MSDRKSIPYVTKPAVKPDNVVLAGKADEEGVFDLLMNLAEENAMFDVDDECVYETIRMATERRGGIIGIIKDGGKPVASIGLFLDRMWYTKDWYVAEYWNYVHPDYRRKPYFSNLVNFSKWVNENMGIFLNMGVMSMERTDAKVKVLGRKLNYIGALFMNGIPQGKEASLSEMDH